ncbi:hypothetical protein [Pseudomonas sp. Q1-7]|uniref:hypothetical protein n=1 Tax=Pseudomonas sp. Q1-7 TaxID=3020843 RepID=UPI0023017EFF|nr:hypothetical protein [Pseudomonas sp. Q1-7]
MRQALNAAAEALEQAAQAFGHVLHRLHQLAEFVLAPAADVDAASWRTAIAEGDSHYRGD